MLHLLGKGNGWRLCDGISRRDALQVGGLTTLGLGLPDLLRSEAQGALTGGGSTFGRAKRVILFFMWGGPAHQDIWDLKPEGPEATRGEFLPTATTVPGLHISEHLPLIARQTDKLAIIRSVGQDDNNHSTGAHAGLTGRRHDVSAENFGARDIDFPHYGSVLSQLMPNAKGMPTFVALPRVITTTNGPAVPGQFGGLIGKRFDPFQISDYPDQLDFQISSLSLPQGLALNRMEHRRDLLQQVELGARMVDRARNIEAMDAYYQQALDMVLAPAARQAFDLASVPLKTRHRYGFHTFGQGVLLAKRLVDAGVKLITVYWHIEKKGIDSTWDTHARNFEELRSRLLPSVDRPIAALLEDLGNEGTLDETLVIWNSEFGRTPNVNGNGGRDHWGPCNSVVMAGGGVPGGQVFGASDEKAAYPTTDKVTQDDIAATIYHLLGLEPETLIHDRQNRPYPVALGQPIAKLLGGLSRPSPGPVPKQRDRIPRIGPFTRLLMERGRRHLTVDLGNPDSEVNWGLAGWSDPAGSGLQRYRQIGDQPATIQYQRMFYNHFDYGWLVFRLAEPMSLQGVKLTSGAKAIPIPDSLFQNKPGTIWQIPFPPGLVASIKTFEVSLQAPGWKVTDIAVVGDPILDVHLKLLNEFVDQT